MPTSQERYAALTEGDKERFIVVAMNSKMVDTDWEAAAKDYSKSTAASLRTVFQRSLKKMSGDAAASDGKDNTANSTPGTKSGKPEGAGASGGKKRKNGGDDKDGQDSTPSKHAKAGKNAKKTNIDVVDAVKDTVKKEQEENDYAV